MHVSEGDKEFAAEQLERWTGLHLGADRRSDLMRGLTRLKDNLGVENADDVLEWLKRCSGTPQEQALLATSFTIGETHFYRDKSLFDRFAQWVTERNFGPQEPVSIWSAGCSSGEEVYTIAALLMRNLNRSSLTRVELLGTDLNEDALGRARAGIYGKWSFRDVPPDFQAKFFETLPDGRWQVRPEIARIARFQVVNLNRGALPEGPFDLIFCRNVVMYFRVETARQVLKRLVQRLKPGGLLAVAPAEAGLVEECHLSDWGAGVFVRPTDETEAPEPVPTVPERAPVEASLQTQAAWHLATEKANKGQLEDALHFCLEVVRQCPQKAEAHRLLARIYDGLGRPADAATALYQALFLEPDSVSDLFLLGVLLERSGDKRRALQTFRQALSTMERREGASDWTRDAVQEAIRRLERG